MSAFTKWAESYGGGYLKREENSKLFNWCSSAWEAAIKSVESVKTPSNVASDAISLLRRGVKLNREGRLVDGYWDSVANFVKQHA